MFFKMIYMNVNSVTCLSSYLSN